MSYTYYICKQFVTSFKALQNIGPNLDPNYFTWLSDGFPEKNCLKKSAKSMQNNPVLK